MRRALLFMLLFMMLTSCRAEETVQQIIGDLDMSGVYEFAREHEAEDLLREVIDRGISGEAFHWNEIISLIKREFMEPLQDMVDMGKAMLIPVLMTALMSSVMSASNAGTGGACFMMRMMLLASFSDVAIGAIVSAGKCLETAIAFSNVAAPPLTALLTAMGMNSSSALLSPAAAVAANTIQMLFLDWGLPLCRLTLCLAIAGNLSGAIDLSRTTKLFKKTVNWGSGLATTLFTALIALQGNAAQSMDGLAVRTAKFAVDSAAPVIGSGISDAWESYISALILAKNAVGLSGIAVLFSAGIKPVLRMIAAMFLLEILSAMLGVAGEKHCERAAEQISGICQMALALSTGALAISTVLLGAVMSIGRSISS